MWDNLTLKQKAEVMKLAVQQGISDLDSIRDLYNTSVNTFSVGGPKNNKKKSSGYSPSTSIKKQIAQWEGASMYSPASDTGKVNRSFDDEARDFNAVNRSLPGFDGLSQKAKDGLFSFSYNVGIGNYKYRVLPVLRKFLMGQATVEDVQNSMWASKDSDPRMSGLRRRRAAERNLFAEGLGQDGVAYTSDDIPEEITWENYKKKQATQNMQNMQILNGINAINNAFPPVTSAPTTIIPDFSSRPKIKDDDYLIKDTPKQNRGIGILPAIKLITQGPEALLSSFTPASSYDSSSDSLFGFLSPIKFDKGGSKINQQDLDRNNWRWATRDELQEDDPLINTLGDNDKWIVNSEGKLVPTSKVNEWLNSYERQTPYQEQNDIAAAREIELKQQHRANQEFNRQMDNLWGFNWMYPSQILGAFNPAGDNGNIPFAQRLFLGTGNTGAVSHKFAAEHPYLAAGTNLLFDIATPEALLKGIPEMYNTAKYNPYMLSRAMNAALKRASVESPVLTPNYRYKWGDLELNNPIKVHDNSIYTFIPERGFLKGNLNQIYDRALAQGDSYLQQRVRNLNFLENSRTKLVNDAGDPQNLWHGSPNHFTEYDPLRFGTVTDEGYYGKGLYTSQDYNTAAPYGRNGYMYNFYVNSKNPFKVGFYNNEFSPFSREELEIRSGIAPDFNRDTRHILTGYDEGLVSKLRTELANSDAVIMSYPKGSTGFKYDEVVIPTPEQLKLADAVTFDNSGMIIPLSERDNFSIKDFRYSKGGKIKNKK